MYIDLEKNFFLSFYRKYSCIAVHFADCHALYNNKNKKIGKNRC